MTTCPACATKFTSAPSRGLISIRHGTGEQNIYSGGPRCEFGGTGGARGHILCPTKVIQIDTVFFFVKKLSKTVKKGYPYFYLGFGNLAGTLGPHPSCGPSEGQIATGGPSPGGYFRTCRNFEVGGGPKCRKGQNCVFRRGPPINPP